MEFSHNQGYSRDKGCTKCFPAAVLDDEVEEHIRGWKTLLRDKRAVEQGLMIDSLGLPGNELVWILRRGWCRPRGGAGSLSFYRDRLMWSHYGRSSLGFRQTRKKGEITERAAKTRVGGK